MNARRRVGALHWSLQGLLGLLAACHNDAGALYANDPLDSGSTSPGTRDAGTSSARRDSGAMPAMRTPYETALAIYGTDRTCLACVERSCDQPARACAGDETCLQDAECRVDCGDNPYCQWDCKLAHSKADRPTFPLEDCIIEGCFEDCRAGRSFDCVGRFARPTASASEPLVQIWKFYLGFAGLPFPEGIRARLCPGNALECTEPAFETFSDAEGVVRVEWPGAIERFGSVIPFQGYLELVDPQDPPRIVPHIIVSNAPVANPLDWPYEISVPTPQDATLLETVLGVPYDPTRGMVVGIPYDCRASERVRGVCVTFEVEPDASDTRFFYGTDPVATCSTPEPNASGGFAYPVPPGFVTWTHLHEGTVVARAGRVPVRPGARTVVALLPE